MNISRPLSYSGLRLPHSYWGIKLTWPCGLEHTRSRLVNCTMPNLDRPWPIIPIYIGTLFTKGCSTFISDLRRSLRLLRQPVLLRSVRFRNVATIVGPKASVIFAKWSDIFLGLVQILEVKALVLR